MENPKKIKVGIVTFHTGDNYGAVLQAYALQKYLEREDFDVKIIDFCTQNHDKGHCIFRKMSLSVWKNAIIQLFLLYHYIPLRKRINRFSKFRKQFFYLTDHQYKTEDDFIYHMEYFDYYISGSDQVFHPRVKYSKCYYLTFPKRSHSKKIAYAPSFGITDFSDEEKIKIKKMVSDFDSLSCREESGSKLLSDLLHQKIPVVCDPVFLLRKCDWLKVCIIPKEKAPFIFIYALHDSMNLIKMARKIKKLDRKLKIICSTTNIFQFNHYVKIIRDLGPREFLGYLLAAEYVLTDSFHGTALSLVMGKKVITLNSFKAVSSRIYSLMNQLGTSSQVVEDADHFSFEKICFEDYSSQIEVFINQSKDYLRSSLRS